MNESAFMRSVEVRDHRLIRGIARGAYGEVWLAENALGTPRAVKIVFRDQFEEDRPYLREFEGVRRYEPLSRDHEGLADILQVGIDEDQGYFYYVMELADNIFSSPGNSAEDDHYEPMTFRSLLRRQGGKLPALEVARIGERLSSALAILHAAGLVHRDVKPANIIFVNGTPKLADAGLVAGRGGEHTFVGTEGYIPREGPGEVAADIYALGLVLYEAASGRHRMEFPSFPQSFPSNADGEAYAELNQVLLKAAAANASSRHRSALELQTELLQVAAGQSIRQLRAGERRLKFLKRTAAFLSVAVLLSVIGSAWQSLEARRSRELAEVQTRAARIERDTARKLRENLYAADLAAAQRLVEKGNRGAAKRVLHSLAPAPGELDLRDFGWHWLNAQLAGDPHHVLPPLGQILFDCCFDNHGRLWSAGIDGQLRCSNPADGSTEIIDRGADGESLYHVSLLPSGGYMFGGKNGLYRAVPGRTRDMLIRRTSMFWSVSRDGRWAAGSSHDQRNGSVNEIVIDDLSGKSAPTSLPDTRDQAAFSPDNSILVTGSEQGGFRLWRLGDSIVPAAELEHVDLRTPCLGLTFSADGKRIAASLGKSTVLVWDADSHELVFRVTTGVSDGAWSPCFSPDGKWLAAAVGQEVWLIRVEDGSLVRRFLGHEDDAKAVCFSEDGKQLASAGIDGVLRIWDVANPVAPQSAGGPNLMNPPVFSRDGRFLAGVNRGQPVLVRDMENPDDVPASFGSEHDWPLAFSPDHRTLFTTNRFWELNAWNWRNGEKIASVPLELPLEGNGSAVSLSPDGRFLCGGTLQGLVVIWDTQYGRIAHRLAGHTQPVERVAFSQNGHWLATSGDDRSVRIWNTRDWNIKYVFPHGNCARGLAFSPNGHWLATACWDGLTRIFDLNSGELLHKLDQDTPSIDGIALSPDNATLAVSRSDRNIALRDTRTWRATVVLPGGGANEYHHLMFSPNGTLLMGNSDDGASSHTWHLH